MANLRPHRHFNFVGLWKKGFILSGILIVLSLVGLIASFAMTGSPVTLGTEFSGGTSIQITDTGDMTEDQVREAFDKAAQETGHDATISSLQTASSANTGNGFIIRTADTVSADITDIMVNVEQQLGVSEDNVQIETIGASWGAAVIWRSFLAFIISCLAILVVIAARYREPRMGVVALLTLFHDMLIVVGIYAWAGLFFHMEVTSDVIAALLAIIGYSLYDTIVSFHRINQNASPAMKMSLKTCANMSVNQICMRSLNTSITSILPVLLMLILGTDTLKDFAFAMFCGMVIGIYSTFAISTPVYTMWKIRDPQYKRLEEKYPYEVLQSPFTKEMMIEARKLAGITNTSTYTNMRQERGLSAIAVRGEGNKMLLAVVGPDAATYTPTAAFRKLCEGEGYVYYVNSSVDTSGWDAIVKRIEAESVEEPEAPFEDRDVTIYVSTKLPAGWSSGSVNYWVWSYTDGSNLCNNKNWPGDKVTQKKTVDGTEWFYRTYSVTKANHPINIVLSSGSGTPQTVDFEDIETDRYLEVSADKSGSKNIIKDVTEQHTTGITEINSEADNANSKVYSISGQMEGYGTQNLKPGLYIKDGKKIIVR